VAGGWKEVKKKKRDGIVALEKRDWQFVFGTSGVK